MIEMTSPLQREWQKTARLSYIGIIIALFGILVFIWANEICVPSEYGECYIDEFDKIIYQIPAFFVIILGAIFLIRGIRNKSKTKKKLVIGLVVNSNVYELDELARVIGIPKIEIETILYQLVSSGQLQGKIGKDAFTPINNSPVSSPISDQPYSQFKSMVNGSHGSGLEFSILDKLSFVLTVALPFLAILFYIIYKIKKNGRMASLVGELGIGAFLAYLGVVTTAGPAAVIITAILLEIVMVVVYIYYKFVK